MNRTYEVMLYMFDEHGNEHGERQISVLSEGEEYLDGSTLPKARDVENMVIAKWDDTPTIRYVVWTALIRNEQGRPTPVISRPFLFRMPTFGPKV